jgi:SAM-dependent methyltransferase
MRKKSESVVKAGLLKTERLSACPLCGFSNIIRDIRGNDYETAIGAFDIYTCGKCGITFTNPRIAADDLDKLYALRMTADFPKTRGFANYLRAFAISRSLKFVKRFVPGNQLCVLDYGCGEGTFSVEIAKKNWVLKLVSCDFHEKAPLSILRTNSIRYISYSKFLENDSLYDLVFCRHVLEHLREPKLFLENIKLKIKPGGFLVVEAPNYDSVWKKIFGKYFQPLYVPRHLFHFTKKTMVDILSEFSIKKISFIHTPIMGKSISYLTGISMDNISLGGLLLFPIQITVDFLCGKSTALLFIAQKIDEEERPCTY